MRNISLLLINIVCVMHCMAQTIVNPVFDRSDTPAFRVEKVEISPDTTFVYCTYNAKAGSWVSISANTFLRDSKMQRKFPLYRCSGVPFSPQRRTFAYDETCEFLFCYPSISGLEQFDFIEEEGEKAFNIYGISLKKSFKDAYTESGLKQISNMYFYYDSIGDAKKAIMYKEQETEAISFFNGIKSDPYLLAVFDLYHTYEKYSFHKESSIQMNRLTDLAVKKALEKKYSFDIQNENYEKYLLYLILSDAYYHNNELTNALKYGIEASKISKMVLGPEHLFYAGLLHRLAGYYSELGIYSEAIKLETETTAILKKVIGTNHLDYARSLESLADYYSYYGNYEEAIRLGTEAIEIEKEVLGVENTEHATSIHNLANNYAFLGNYTEALRLEMKAMEIVKKVLGTGHHMYATTLNNLAKYYSFLGNYVEAIKIGTEAKEIRKNIFGTKHPRYAMSLCNLAEYYSDLGNYTEALRLGEEAIEIVKTVLGTEHPDYSFYLNDIAIFNCKLGNYHEMIKMGTEAVEILKKVFGTNNPEYAKSLGNLAEYYYILGDYPEALRLCKEERDILKNVFGTEHPSYVITLGNLAKYYESVGNYTEAKRIGTEAMEIGKSVFGTENPTYAFILNNLAEINADIGNYSEAKRLETEAMGVDESVLGTEHPEYAKTLGNLAKYNNYLGNYPEAIRLGIKAKEILKDVLGTESPEYVTSLYILANYNYKIGNYAEAYRYLIESVESYHTILLKGLGELSSRHKESLWTRKCADLYMNDFPCYVAKFTNKESVIELYNKSCLFAKGILLNTGIEMRKIILESGNSLLIDKYDSISTNISIYNKLIEKPIRERFMNADSLNNVILRQEMELARESKIYGDFTRNLTICWSDVQKKLGKDDIAIEFLDFPIAETDSTMYAALTLKKGYDSPHMVMLFERSQMKTIPENAYYSNTTLSNLIWKPLEDELKEVKNIYFSPSGELHRIGIEYLPMDNEKKMCDKYTLHRLSSTRQLALIQDETKGEQNILYGGLDYDMEHETTNVDTTQRSVYTREIPNMFRANVDSLALRASYDYLEGTKKEADQIAADMETHHIPHIYLYGGKGSEESFKNLNGTKPELIHIATHGFYMTEDEAAKSKFAKSQMVTILEDNLRSPRLLEDKYMSRSGLLFSGCNHAINHETIPEGAEDGILTALEISTLDLRGLDLVVLSACQTGLGDITSGEGVFGLQRGFKKAGARTIIMSLWKVNDESTMKLMTSFYHYYLEGMSKEKAFHAAQDELRKDSLSQQEWPDWAAFILLDGIN